MYKRILLKLSGEALIDQDGNSIGINQLEHYCSEISDAYKSGVQIAIVIGGGNIFRGIQGAKRGFSRIQGDYMGMMATIINSLALEEMLLEYNIPSTILGAIEIDNICKKFYFKKAIDLLENNKVIILSGGTGNPLFTTDSAAALRAIEINADILLKGTKVDGVYTEDPFKNPNAQKYEYLSLDEAFEKKLKILDLTAYTLCMENNLPIIVYDATKKGNLKKILEGEKIGTLIK
ncbi:MAG: UMP kinase [Bacteroidales bacterium]|jgi:uridylate kinase|nr:UMP kinase [Bacteroidales bacterium]MDI9576463.1 UMP kinase [Bacteroidota bacterium]MDD2592930.1 UMP kinase [Bacteroidales bacterium]MDD3755821.1 UMP kinase [Bacteroidales bacterium]MDY0401120.1 UMP kinase [Bacteroidales bacterium]